MRRWRKSVYVTQRNSPITILLSYMRPSTRINMMFFPKPQRPSTSCMMAWKYSRVSLTLMETIKSNLIKYLSKISAEGIVRVQVEEVPVLREIMERDRPSTWTAIAQGCGWQVPQEHWIPVCWRDAEGWGKVSWQRCDGMPAWKEGSSLRGQEWAQPHLAVLSGTKALRQEKGSMHREATQPFWPQPAGKEGSHPFQKGEEGSG